MAAGDHGNVADKAGKPRPAKKPQSGDRIQPGVSAPGRQATPPISALKGRRKNAADGVANPIGE